MLPRPQSLSPIFKIFILICFGLTSFATSAQSDSVKTEKPVVQEKKWYDKLSIRGYSQVRYNRLFETNPDLGCEQCDKSWGDNNGVFIRRGRVIISGMVTDRVYIYVQPDFAAAVSTNSQHFLQIRDFYADYYIDKKQNFRLRFGQSKIPYGFENMQSSSNRLPLDRNDALNSALPNERDLGAIVYYTPKKVRDFFAEALKTGIKGSGDYGMIGFGIYNGQAANRAEQNNNLHIVGRITYPFMFKSQVLEVSAQAYTGKVVITSDQISSGTKVNASRNYLDERAALSLILYPKPFGIMTEYNIGKGPKFNTVTDSIETAPLRGGYVMINYTLKLNNQIFFPFARGQYYNGGKKQEKDARAYEVTEYEAGIEWQLNKGFEFTASYVISDRKYEDFVKQDNRQKGQLLRLQAQMNF